MNKPNSQLADLNCVTPGIVELDTCQFIKFSGPDVIKFLQGQLSCNMDLLSDTRSLRGAICNLQGRVIADVRLVKVQDECVMQVSAGMANTVVNTLSKYSVFSKVKLEIQDVHPAPFGIIGTPPVAILQLFGGLPEQTDSVVHTPEACLLKAPGEQPCYELWFYQRHLSQTFQSSIADQLTSTQADWHRTEIQAGVVHVNSSNTEEYTPQLLNYDISGVIDFKKGCYTGQEVVARMFYRGIAKKRMYLGSTAATVTVDDSVYQVGDESSKSAPILTFSNAAKGSGQPDLLLTILPVETVENGATFTLADDPSAAVTVRPLTY